MGKQRLLSRLCAACRWMPDAIFCFHFCLRFCLIFNRWSHIWLHFQPPALGFKHVIDYGQNSAVWEHVYHEGFQRKKQPVVVLDMSHGDSTCKSIDGCCLSPILSCLLTSMFPYAPAFQSLPRTKVKMTLKRGLGLILFSTWHGHRQSWHSSCHVADCNMHPLEKDETGTNPKHPS